MSKNRIVVGNWKMNPESFEEAREIFLKIKRRAIHYSHVQTVICPSDLHVASLAKLASGGKVKIGVQDVFWEDQGFFTGRISPKMAYDAGARFSIIGHSESRKLGETSVQVAKKIKAVIKDKMTAILCVGEEKRDPEGEYLAFLRDQIVSSLSGVPVDRIKNGLIVAYEPVWEIGRKDMKSMGPSDVRETTIFIKKVLTDAFGEKAAEAPVLYGGSVSEENAGNLISSGGVSGFLVGRQSLKPESFGEILRAADECR